MIERSSRGKFPSLRFVKNLDVLGILWGEFLLYFFGGLGQSSRKSELPNVRVVLPQYSTKSCFVPLLSIDSGGELGVILLQGMEIS